MRQLLIVLAIVAPMLVFGQTATSSDSTVKLMHALYIKGLKAIRHDALITFKFRYAHHIKKVIRHEEADRYFLD
jgi:hypothetical protein